MPNRTVATRSLPLSLVISASMLAQTGSGPTGYWEGPIQDPGKELKVGVALARSGDKWVGNIAVPAQNIKAYPLHITVEGEAVTFPMAGAPGDPVFKGTVSKDGKTLTGEFSQATRTLPFALTRTASTPITKDVVGFWEAEVPEGGKTLRLTLTLSNGPSGSATGTFISVDQGLEESPIVAIIQTGSHLLFRAAHGTYEGDLKDGQLVGTWTQGPRPAPLVFKRAKPQ
jgi:hypothetical protein